MTFVVNKKRIFVLTQVFTLFKVYLPVLWLVYSKHNSFYFFHDSSLQFETKIILQKNLSLILNLEKWTSQEPPFW